MGGTALKRKARKNIARAKAKNHAIKVRGFKPVIKTVDVEAIKEEFKKKLSSAKPKVEKVKEETTNKKDEAKDAPVEAKVDKVQAKAEVKVQSTTPKKASAKKAPSKKGDVKAKK
jgi:hypothetical protein